MKEILHFLYFLGKLFCELMMVHYYVFIEVKNQLVTVHWISELS